MEYDVKGSLAVSVNAFMPTLERLKAVGGVWVWVWLLQKIFFSERRKMVPSAAFWIYNLCSQNFRYSMIKP